MFDSIGAFEKQFTPVESGYLVHPSRKHGGKLVTLEEYALLVADWERVAGRTGVWKLVGIVMLALLAWVLVSDALALPEWTDAVFNSAMVIAVSARVLWASFAPCRLVASRAAVTPPRPRTEARREARAALNWPFITFALLLGALQGLSHGQR